MKTGKAIKDPLSYVDRDYRQLLDTKTLVASLVRVKETDLQIFSEVDVTERASELALQLRLQLEAYLQSRPGFEQSLVPMADDILAPPVVKEMLLASKLSATGPMAAVAGAISEYVGKGLLDDGCQEVMVENGGDLFIQRNSDTTIAIFAGESPLSLRIGLKVGPDKMPLGICTSSGRVGHSMSFGVADSVTVLAKSTPLADAAATRLGNEVKQNRDSDGGIRRALEESKSIVGLLGVVVVCGDKMGAVGDIELVRLT